MPIGNGWWGFNMAARAQNDARQFLADHIRELELELAQERGRRNEEVHRVENQLFEERGQHENLIHELGGARDEIQRLKALVDQKLGVIQGLEQRLVLLEGQINAVRGENQALANQVAQEREQVRGLTAQLERAIARANALDAQLRIQNNQMAVLLRQNQEILQSLRKDSEERKLSQENRFVDRVSAAYEDHFAAVIGPIKENISRFFSFLNR